MFKKSKNGRDWFWGFISSVCSFIAWQAIASIVKIGFDQISPSASSTRDYEIKRLKEYDISAIHLCTVYSFVKKSIFSEFLSFSRTLENDMLKKWRVETDEYCFELYARQQKIWKRYYFSESPPIKWVLSRGLGFFRRTENLESLLWKWRAVARVKRLNVLILRGG